MKKIAPILLLFLLMLSCSSCLNLNEKLRAKPTAYGKTNQIFVIADNDDWNGPIGDTIRYYFESAYPILPQPEPQFDLKHFTLEKLMAEQVRKELRVYLIVGDLDDDDSPVSGFIRKDLGEEKTNQASGDPSFNSLVGKDKWAYGQMLIYLFGKGEANVHKSIIDNFPAIAKKVNDFDQKQINGLVYGAGVNRTLSGEIKDSLKLDIKVPKDYYKALGENKTIWIRKETRDLSSNLLISRVPYSSKDQFTKERIKELRDSLGKKHITTTLDRTYMRTNDTDLPMLTRNIKLNGQFCVEARGIWDIVGDFMGGPFISYVILDNSRGELIFIDCFVHAPGTEKRDFMQQLEHIATNVNIM